MRIGIDARFYGGEQSKGLGRYTQKLIEYLLSLKDDENEYVLFLQEEAYRNWNSTNERFIPVLAPYRWYTFAEQIWMPLMLWRAKVDVMHFPHFNVPLLYRKPFVVTIHDLIILRFPTSRATTLGPVLYKLKHWAGQLVMRHAAKNAQHILTVSEFSKQDIIQQYNLSQDRISVTYLAADLHTDFEYEEDRYASVQKKYSLPQQYILHVGNAYPHKNLEMLLSVMQQYKKEGKEGIELVLVGKQDYFFGKIQQEAWARDVDDVVHFPGFVPDRDLPYLYHGALAYVFPSKYEGFGLPPLEAMKYGTPVLAAKASCLPEILGDGAEYFELDDISGIINSLERIASSPNRRRELMTKGFAQVRQYSWDRMAKQTRDVYANIQKKTTKTSTKR
jgi:glycosyltransferase involved in cell wall biosynthesis